MVDREKLKKYFPHLAREIEARSMSMEMRAYRSDVEVAERDLSSFRFGGYVPDVIDFIRRCDTEEQAEEIICFLERRGEVTHEYADRLRKQLHEKGLRSFGSKKEPDYYSKHAYVSED